MGNTDEGMYEIENINEPVMIGNGKQLMCTKIGKLRHTIFQQDGSSLDIVLQDYKYVPGLHLNLFSIVKALHQGWKLSSKGKLMQLQQEGKTITFDQVHETNRGTLCGMEILPR